VSNYLNELNGIQRQAAETTEGPVLIVAGPGSGKTRVLTYRIAHLLDIGAAPYEVLALTFTNKAAREMKDRISKVVGAKAQQVWAGTFHSIFARILRAEADKIGYPRDFTIYDGDDTKSLITNIINEQNLDIKIYNPNEIRQRISSAKSNLISPEEYLKDPELVEQDQKSKRPFLGKIYQLYLNRCKKAGAMDFDDLLYQFYHLLNSNQDVVNHYRRKFKYLMVDEFQDTNYLQYAIVRKLVVYPGSKRNICVVGDDAQSIYAFRGATIQNILDFNHDFKDAVTLKLEQNYRSTNHIVTAANAVIKHNSKQIQKEIWTDKTDGEPIRILKTVSDGEEAKRVADSIMEQKNRYHLKNSEIAILYRTNAQSRNFEEALRRFNVPYRVFGGQSFYQRKEVKDVLGYLRVICNPADEEALRRIINYPARKIGKTTVDKVAQLANEQNLTIWDIITKAPNYPTLGAAANPLKGFAMLMEAFRKRLKTDSAYDLAMLVVKQVGILNELKTDLTPEGIGRLDNVQALLDGIHEFVENDELIDDAIIGDKSLATYLQSIALVSDLDNNSDDLERITLMSVHSAKGLEFKSVFVVGLEENLFPSFMAKTPVELDEERRLFYVAITRAEQFLTLTFAATRYKFGQHRTDPPSRFLSEIGQTISMASKTVEPQRSSVSGLGIRTGAPLPNVEVPENFKPSPIALIKTGAIVFHQRFGKGEVKSTDGKGDGLIAVIYFSAVKEEKKIMLKFAKLMILN
jgi:DNA helicase-2/ATP-dependent DNA helicase PcrA